MQYSNIFPLDANRVVLKTSGEGPGTDYINATHVVLPALKGERLIAAQAPMHPAYHGPDTCGDFWRAVFEQDVGVIVALASVQRGFSGSAPYVRQCAVSSPSAVVICDAWCCVCLSLRLCVCVSVCLCPGTGPLQVATTS